MNLTPRNMIVGTALLLVAAAGVWFFARPGPLDAFAQCLGERGAVFYGAFWCPHCQNQKAELGRSARLLPYVECSTPDGKGQLAICREKGIESYPTWLFADGSRESGELSLGHLAEKTGCTLPSAEEK